MLLLTAERGVAVLGSSVSCGWASRLAVNDHVTVLTVALLTRSVAEFL